MVEARSPVEARRFAHGLVIGKFYPLHSGHSALIRAALRASDRVTVQVLGSSVESIPLDVRAAWLREEHPTARIVSAVDDAPVDFGSDAAWQSHTALIAGLLDEPVDVVFTSDAYGEELARRLGATWRRVDAGRAFTPVSGTAIRADVAAHWHELPSAAREWLGVRIVVLGAESTGSTTLAGALAAELGAAWVPEYGRAYSVAREGGLEAAWRTSEFDLIVDRQIDGERRALRTMPTPVLVCDTDVLATALWHERYVGEAAPRILARARAHPPELYILTGDEIPFVQDGTRDGEHVRYAMQFRFRDTLAASGVPWLEVRGDVPTRVARAMPAIESAVTLKLSFAPPLEARPWGEQVEREAQARGLSGHPSRRAGSSERPAG